MIRQILAATLIGAGLSMAGIDSLPAQDALYSSPSVDYYINRTRGQDTPRVGLRSIVQRDLNRGRPTADTLQPEFLQRGRAANTASTIDKPFSSASHRPTVSPYLNLLREDFADEIVPNYHTLVRPQLQQIQFQQQQQQRSDLLYRQLQQIQARAPFTPQGSQMMNPTGHVTTFQFLSSYYPQSRR